MYTGQEATVDMEQHTGSKLGKEYIKAVYCHPAYLTSMQRVGFRYSSVGKESACNAEDSGSILGWGRSPGEGNGKLLPYSCLGNPMDRWSWRATVHEVTKSRTQLSMKHYYKAESIGKCQITKD